MSDHPLRRLEFSSRVAKRAQYEAFAFSLLPTGDVRVRNESHAEPDDHEYRVRIRDGVPAACSCPADTRFEGACKHRVAVAMRGPILEVVAAARTITDGGVVERDDRDGGPPVDCACASLDGRLPCWACVRANHKSLPGRADES